MFGGGLSNFLGDLGGRNQIGTDYSLADLDLQAIAWNVQLGYRYRFKEHWATTTTVYGGIVRGNDNNTQELIRKSRNLHFRSPIISISQRAEWIYYNYEQFGGRYNIPGIRRRSDRNTQFYLFGGVGVTYFNPQAKYNDIWVNLRPLHTEGQGLPGGADEYGRFTVIVPMGFGFRWGINRVWRFGVEFSYTKTFSDYIDDVSTNYYSKSTLEGLYGDEAAYFSNPAYKNQQWFAAGEQRGDAEKDSYVYMNLVFYRNLTYKPTNYKGGRKPKYRGGGRYKF